MARTRSSVIRPEGAKRGGLVPLKMWLTAESAQPAAPSPIDWPKDSVEPSDPAGPRIIPATEGWLVHLQRQSSYLVPIALTLQAKKVGDPKSSVFASTVVVRQETDGVANKTSSTSLLSVNQSPNYCKLEPDV